MCSGGRRRGVARLLLGGVAIMKVRAAIVLSCAVLVLSTGTAPAQDEPTAPTPPPSETPPSPPPGAPPSPPAETPPPPSQAPSAEAPARPGHWVYTHQYGWVWMPYADQYTYVPPNGYGVPYSYVYYPAYGWSWVAAPWIWGFGPWPYFGVGIAVNFGWYAAGYWRYPSHWHYVPGSYGRPGHGYYGYYGRPAPGYHGYYGRPAPGYSGRPAPGYSGRPAPGYSGRPGPGYYGRSVPRSPTGRGFGGLGSGGVGRAVGPYRGGGRR
jgi:hypothetical protein